MKKEFSKNWKGSKQPRKQRKYLAKAPLHLRKKLVSVNLSKELRGKYGLRNVPVRKGDTVKVMKGKFKKKQGKITRVFLNFSKVLVEGIQVKKMDGSKADIKMQPSNLQIIELNTDDQKRMKRLKKNLVGKEKPKKEESKKKDKESKR